MHYFGYERIAKDGIARGYMTMAWHLYHALKLSLGNTLQDCPIGEKRSRVCLHVTPPHVFHPTPGAVNVLFSMWEGSTLPSELVDKIRSADVCLVPSRFCQEVWAKYGVSAHVVRLGVPGSVVLDGPRPRSTEPRVLFVGSNLPRKGWQLLAPAWEMLKPKASLYLKTITEQKGIYRDPSGSVQIDTRDLTSDELFDLYRSAEIFVFPSYGEGFGLTVLEAMASGCVCVTTDAGGLSEFVSSRNAIIIDRPQDELVTYGSQFDLKIPTAQSVSEAIGKALALTDAERNELVKSALSTADGMTWEDTASGILDVASNFL